MRKREQETVGKTETFFSRNVRLITFLICMAVFFGTVGPWSVFKIYEYIGQAQDTRVEMTLSDLHTLAARSASLTQKDLDGFYGERDVRTVDGIEVEVYYQIPIGQEYSLFATSVTSTGRIMYLQLTDLNTFERIDLLDKNADLDAFLQSAKPEN